MSQRHLVECHCVLPIYKDKKPILYHKFAVYSKVDQNDKVIPKYVNCNNCGVTHFVFEYCKSEITIGKEDVTSIRSKNDISISIPEKICNILEEYQATVDVYEEVEDVLENKLYPRNIVLSREILENNQIFKLLSVITEDKFKINSEVINTAILKE
jgi:hypothetical protein